MTQETEPARPATNDLVTLLDAADRLPAVRALRARSYDLLDAGPGARAVDVGCGAGRPWPN
ncbi:hypothetical protein [Streptomyces sp. B6B3]|uniref:hypothetical protein n=1 Tax=Streptomyces sp. B6B3 TaxID=3153570 RepID=UPI00325CADF2